MSIDLSGRHPPLQSHRDHHDGPRGDLHHAAWRTQSFPLSSTFLTPPLTTYLQFRSNWSVDPQTGTYSTAIRSPTDIPTDPPLTSHGVAQAQQLAAHVATLEPPPTRVYSSPYYRCLQTVAPVVPLLRSRAGVESGPALAIRPENGLGEWFGAAPFAHPAPAPGDVLAGLFPGLLAREYSPVEVPARAGETMAALHERVARTLARLAAAVDGEDGGPRALLLCTHAATLIACGRVLTGRMPARVEEADFRPFTCGLSRFERRRRGPTSTGGADGEEATDWRDGRGVAGGWDCTLNGDCSFLDGGEERGW